MTRSCGFVLANKVKDALLGSLKEQYPVTAHAPNFDFWTGCREIKRCVESKRTLKNPFASRLAELDTRKKLLRKSKILLENVNNKSLSA